MSKSLAGIVVFVALLVSCTRPNPNRCCGDAADCNANGIPTGSTCQEGLVCRGHQCISEPCSTAAECDPAAPYCVDSLCAEACTMDDQCPGFGGNGDSVYCVTGSCATCRDSSDCSAASAPVCDAGVCRGCTDHSECASGLCDGDVGTCIVESRIAYVAPTASATSLCTRADPCSIDRAFTVLGATRNYVKLLPGTHVPMTTISPPANFDVHVFGPATLGGSFRTLLNSTMRIRDLDVAAGENVLQCSRRDATQPSPAFDVDRVTFAPDNRLQMMVCTLKLRHARLQITAASTYQNAISLSGDAGQGGSDLTLAQSEIIGGQRGITVSDRSSVSITNCIFRDQGLYGAMSFSYSAGPSTLAFSTLYNSYLDCPLHNTGDGGLVLAAHDNVMLNDGTTVVYGNEVSTSDRCSHQYDLIKPQPDTPNGASNLLNMDPLFINAAAGDLHLMAGSPAIDAADPAATETIDFEGTSRPQGGRRDMGAFEFKP